MTHTNETTVLVTGASGFIAMHCVLQLLEAGYRVRGTVRSREKDEELRAALSSHVELGDRFDTVEADLTVDAGWSDAVAGCRYVLHVASPLPAKPPKDENELILPAREGTLRVLRASADAGVERVVLTSSVAAVLYGRDRSRTFGESEWSNVESSAIGAYEKSKTLAERAAWEFMDQLEPRADGTRMELAVVNPGLVLGPILSADYGTSGEVVKKLMDRDFPAIPNLNWAVVDVRDVAAAHLAAMTVDGAAGHRHILALGNRSMRELAEVLAAHVNPKGYRVPTGKLPSFLLKIISWFDPAVRLVLNDLDTRQDVDNTRMREVLGIEPRSLDEMTVSMADSLIGYGVTKP